VETLTPMTERLESEHNFVPDVGHLTVFGHCQDCR
jgi:Fur family ferric uptake transcriptional regulator